MKISLLFSVLLYSQFVFGQFPSNLKAYFPFNGNTKDTLSNSSPGIVNGATYTTDRNNVVNRAFLFDGTGANVTLGSDLNYGTTSVAFWFKPGNVFQEQMLYSNWANIAQNTTSQLEIRISTAGKINVAVGNSFNFPNNFRIYSSTSAVDMNKWNHVTVEINNNFTQVTIYINGHINFDSPITGITYSQCVNPIRVGARYNGITENPFIGKIDDVMIFNKALSDAEAKSIYDLTNGIEHNNFKVLPQITVFPNPVNLGEDLNLQIDGQTEDLKCMVYSAEAREISFSIINSAENKMSLKFKDIKPGIYYIILSNKSHSITKRFECLK